MRKKSERCRIKWSQIGTQGMGRWKGNICVEEPGGRRVPACGSSLTHLECL